MSSDDYPIMEVAAKADELIQGGATIWQKWTCSHCGARQTMDTPNVMYLSGTCEECGGLTQIEACNYMMLRSGDPGLHKKMVDAIGDSMKGE